MSFVSSFIEANGIIEKMFGSNSKEIRSFQKVLQGYVIKKTKTREDSKQSLSR